MEFDVQIVNVSVDWKVNMPASTRTEWRIGALAAELGINAKTIRYYGEIGLLAAPRRTAAGYRLYGTAERDRLRFILKAKSMGLKLDEIRAVLGIRRGGADPCTHVLKLFDEKLTAVEHQLELLHQYRAELLDLRSEADRTSQSPACVCRIIEQHEVSHPDAARQALAVLSHQEPGSRGLA